MNQRILFPSFSCSGNACTITAPPNVHVCPPGWFQLYILDGPTPSWSTWVRIGGDPARLGKIFLNHLGEYELIVFPPNRQLAAVQQILEAGNVINIYDTIIFLVFTFY